MSVIAALSLVMLASSDLSAGPADNVLSALYGGHKVRARIGKAPAGKMMLLIDGRPEPLFWASLSSGGEDYRRAGMNAVLAELVYPGKDKTLEEAFQEWNRLLLDIKKQGLYAVIYIHNTIHASAGAIPWAFDDQWKRYVQAIVRRYRPVTNLIAWIFADEVADHLTYPDGAFRAFLRREYPSLEALNRAWDSRYASFEDIRLEYRNDRHGRPEESMATPSHPFGIGPKAFDSARFKAARVAEAHRLFEAAVREVDPDTPLFSGAHNLAWPITGIPEGWGAFFDFYPGNSGHDYGTHHIWAMDIGRGQNERPVMQMLLPERWDDPRWHTDARLLRGWMVESALHGAAGVTFWPWSFLGIDNRPGDRSSSRERIAVCREAIDTLRTSGIFEMLSQNTAAVLYQPYAEGWGAASQVYGVLRHPDEEPYILMDQLKFGTRYGQVDYLTHLDRADLNRYGVILAQFAPDLSARDIARLAAYVRKGGVLMADVGFDCIRAGKTVTAMSREARELFGIRKLAASAAGPGRFAATGHYSDLLGGLKPGEDSTDRLQQMALDVEPDTALPALQGPGKQGLYVNRLGKGYAIFCSVLAWSRWTASDPLFLKIHDALFARRARIELIGDQSKDRPQSFFSDTEASLFFTGYALQNRADAEKTVKVRVNRRLFSHRLPPRSVLLVNRGRSIPLGTGTWPAELGPKEMNP
ncbi:MAG: beta-galactosidase [Armatimonadetes bacterium]|nr:beta-galactosidase [Armatimonadota bacterium]